MESREKTDDELIAEANAAAYDDAGVDLTLIEWMLAMSPLERLQTLERRAAALAPFVMDDAGH